MERGQMLVQTLNDVCNMVRELEGITHIAVDLETTGLDLLDSEVTGIGFASSDKEWYVDMPSMVSWAASSLIEGWLEEMWGAFQPLFDVTKHILISHNTPFDMAFVAREFSKFGYATTFNTCDNWWDTLSMAALVDENLIGVKVELPTADGTTKAVGALSLKALSQVFLGRKQRLWDAFFDDWTVEEKAEYGCADVRNCYDLAVFFSKYLDKIGLMDYYVQYVAPMSYVTCALETNGIKVDVAKLLEVQQSIEKQIAVYAAEMQEIMPQNEKVVFDLAMLGEDPQPQLKTLVSSVDGEFLTASGKVSTSQSNLTMLYNLTPKAPFWQQVTMLEFTPANPRSNAQLGEYLVKKGYRLPLTKTGKPSVSEEVLQIVAKEHPEDPLWAVLFKMRKLEKLKGTYVDACLEMAWEDDRVHPEWNQSGTATGRYSCTSSSKNKELTHKRGPALQTIPRPDTVAEMGWEYNPREWFVAPAGHCLAVADLSQAEVRMLAVMSKDEVLKQAMLAGEDIHSNMAAATQGEKWEKGTKEERKILRGYTKRVTFGSMYGIGPQALSEDINNTVEFAKALLDKFYSTFKGVSDWKAAEAQQLSRTGFVTSFLGRRRTPVLIQRPPRVSAATGPEREQQKLQEALWKAEYDFACEKSGFDPSTSEETERKARAVRQAINFEIQGSVAELVNYGLVGLLRKGYKIIGQVHDEILVELPDEQAARDQFEQDLRGFYEAELNGVPFVVDLHFGSSWACGKE